MTPFVSSNDTLQALQMKIVSSNDTLQALQMSQKLYIQMSQKHLKKSIARQIGHALGFTFFISKREMLSTQSAMM
jgi:hypothetical protein